MDTLDRMTLILEKVAEMLSWHPEHHAIWFIKLTSTLDVSRWKHRKQNHESSKLLLAWCLCLRKQYSVQFCKRMICQIPGTTTKAGFYIYLACVCTCIYANIVLQCMPMCRGQRTIFQGHFSPSTTWVLETEPPGLKTGLSVSGKTSLPTEPSCWPSGHGLLTSNPQPYLLCASI